MNIWPLNIWSCSKQFRRCAASRRPLCLLALSLTSPLAAQEEFLIIEQDIGAFLQGAPAAAAPEPDGQENAGGEEKLDPQARAFLQQNRPPYQARLNGYLHSIRELCNPTREQQELLLEQATDALEQALIAQAKRQVVRNGVNVRVLLNGAAQGDPWNTVELAIGKSIQKHFTPEQREIYQEEAAKRRDFRRRAAASNLVGAIDARICLTPEQREAIHASLLEGWQEQWENSMRSLLYGAQYMPQIPDRLLIPHLDPKQRKLWAQNRSHGSLSFGDNGFLGQGIVQVQPFQVQDQRSEKPDPTKKSDSGETIAEKSSPGA